MLQRAFLLMQLESHADGAESLGPLNKQIGKAAQRELGLTAGVANGVRAKLAAEGFLAAAKLGSTFRYSLTDAGRAYLASLERPALSGRAKTTPPVESNVPEEIRDGQNGYLLLQLLSADGEMLTRSDANKLIPENLRSSLSLTPANANIRRAKLAERGYLRVSRIGRSEIYSLTPDGLEYLAAGARHLDHLEFPVKGKALNALVAAARESSFRPEQPSTGSTPVGAPPDKATLENQVLIEFEELRRERHGRSGLVPIHEVRQRIVERFGPPAGRHDVLDEVILGLWRQQRLGLEGISDLSQATPAQLSDAIPGVSGPLFYLETIREQPAAR
jgi:DNA-binding PadR family transcriptional regulator